MSVTCQQSYSIKINPSVDIECPTPAAYAYTMPAAINSVYSIGYTPYYQFATIGSGNKIAVFPSDETVNCMDIVDMSTDPGTVVDSFVFPIAPSGLFPFYIPLASLYEPISGLIVSVIGTYDGSGTPFNNYIAFFNPTTGYVSSIPITLAGVAWDSQIVLLRDKPGKVIVRAQDQTLFPNYDAYFYVVNCNSKSIESQFHLLDVFPGEAMTYCCETEQICVRINTFLRMVSINDGTVGVNIGGNIFHMPTYCYSLKKMVVFYSGFFSWRAYIINPYTGAADAVINLPNYYDLSDDPYQGWSFYNFKLDKFVFHVEDGNPATTEQTICTFDPVTLALVDYHSFGSPMLPVTSTAASYNESDGSIYFTYDDNWYRWTPA